MATTTNDKKTAEKTTPEKTSREKIMIPDAPNKVPFSVVESYKNIRTNIISVLSKINGKVLAITSPNASEGKSTTSVNIAITLAQLNKKVIILDADSRRPTVHKKLKLENQNGCMDILSGNITVDDAIVHYNQYLDAIPSGTKVKNPSELFSGDTFEELLDELKERYDYIILDTPPINPVTDALIITQKCEAVIMIVRSGVTTYQSFDSAYESLKVLDIELNGVIINGSDAEQGYRYKNRYKYKYKYNNYSNYY